MNVVVRYQCRLQSSAKKLMMMMMMMMLMQMTTWHDRRVTSGVVVYYSGTAVAACWPVRALHKLSCRGGGIVTVGMAVGMKRKKILSTIEIGECSH